MRSISRSSKKADQQIILLGRVAVTLLVSAAFVCLFLQSLLFSQLFSAIQELSSPKVEFVKGNSIAAHKAGELQQSLQQRHNLNVWQEEPPHTVLSPATEAQGL